MFSWCMATNECYTSCVHVCFMQAYIDVPRGLVCRICALLPHASSQLYNVCMSAEYAHFCLMQVHSCTTCACLRNMRTSASCKHCCWICACLQHICLLQQQCKFTAVRVHVCGICALLPHASTSATMWPMK